MKTTKLNRAVAMLLAMLLIFSMTACTSSNEPATTEPTTTDEPTTTEPATTEPEKTYVSKDHIVVVGKTEPASIDPHNGNMVTQFTIDFQVFDRLFVMDENSNITPQLAETWEWIDDTTLRVKIHEGVKFSNGDDLTAEDVLYTLQRGCESSYSAATLDPFDAAACKVVDPYTIDIVTKQPYPGAIATLTHGRASIVCKRAIEEMGDEYSRTPVGSGRLIVDKWTAGDSIEFSRNENYWNEEAKPTFSKLTMRFISENASRAIEVETGAADLALEIAATDMTRLDENPAVNITAVPGATLNQLVINSANFPYFTPEVRRALHMAINTEAITKTAYVTADRADSLLPPSCWGYKAVDESKTAYDPDGAKAILEAEGFDMSTPLVINVAKGNEVGTAAEMICNMWNAIGLNASVEILENATLTTNNSKGQTPICITTYTCACGLPESMFLNFEKTTTYAWTDDMEFVDALKAAKTITDDAARQAEYERLQQYAWDLNNVIPICVSQRVYATGANVEGLQPSPTNQPDFSFLNVLVEGN